MYIMLSLYSYYAQLCTESTFHLKHMFVVLVAKILHAPTKAFSLGWREKKPSQDPVGANKRRLMMTSVRPSLWTLVPVSAKSHWREFQLESAGIYRCE